MYSLKQKMEVVNYVLILHFVRLKRNLILTERQLEFG